MFKKGDKVSHPGHGACTIIDIREQEFTGEKRLYYVLSAMVEIGTAIYVPVDKAAKLGLRELITEQEADDLLLGLDTVEAASWVSDKNKRQKHYETLFEDNSKDSLKQSITAINAMISRKQEKPLGDIEKGMLRNIQNKALSEIALAKGKKLYDKRETIKDRDNKIDLARLKKAY